MVISRSFESHYNKTTAELPVPSCMWSLDISDSSKRNTEIVALQLNAPISWEHSTHPHQTPTRSYTTCRYINRLKPVPGVFFFWLGIFYWSLLLFLAFGLLSLLKWSISWECILILSWTNPIPLYVFILNYFTWRDTLEGKSLPGIPAVHNTFPGSFHLFVLQCCNARLVSTLHSNC